MKKRDVIGGDHRHIFAEDLGVADQVVGLRIYKTDEEHVWAIAEVALWENVKLPDGKILAPGVVTHSTADRAPTARRTSRRTIRPFWSGART